MKVKLKDELPLDEELLKHKDFKTVISGYQATKSSYNQVSSLWGAIIGFAVFAGIITYNLNIGEQFEKIDYTNSYSRQAIDQFLDESTNESTEIETIRHEEVAVFPKVGDNERPTINESMELKGQKVETGTEKDQHLTLDLTPSGKETKDNETSSNKVIKIRYQGQD